MKSLLSALFDASEEQRAVFLTYMRVIASNPAPVDALSAKLSSADGRKKTDKNVRSLTPHLTAISGNRGEDYLCAMFIDNAWGITGDIAVAREMVAKACLNDESTAETTYLRKEITGWLTEDQNAALDRCIRKITERKAVAPQTPPPPVQAAQPCFAQA